MKVFGLSAETMPTVMVLSKPKGLPMATTVWPIRVWSESPRGNGKRISGWRIGFDDRNIRIQIRRDDFTANFISRREVNLEIFGAFNDMIIGDNVAFPYQTQIRNPNRRHSLSGFGWLQHPGSRFHKVIPECLLFGLENQ